MNSGNMAIFGISLALRLTVWFLLLSILPLAVVMIFVLNRVNSGFDALTLHYQRREIAVFAFSLSRLPPDATIAALRDLPPPHDALVLVDPLGRYLFHPDSARLARPIADDFPPEVVQAVLAGAADAIIEPETGRVISFAPIPGRGTMLVASSDRSPTTALMAAIRSSTQMQLGASLALISIVAGGAIWLLVGNPLRQLTRAAQQVSQGQLDVTVDPEETSDELQVLASTFNEMASRLRDLVSRLEQNVADLEQAQLALGASEAYFRALIENAQDRITVLDADGSIRFESPAVERVLGYRPEALLGQSIFAMVHPEDQPVLQELLAHDAGLPRSSRRREIRFRHQNGSWRYLETSAQTLPPNLAVQGRVLNARDITERKQLEVQLRQAQKMEVIGQLAGGIAHDFNNILVPIIGYVELAMMSLTPTDAIYADLQQVHRAAERATILARQILAISRKQVLEVHILDLNTVVAELKQMLQRLIGEHITLETFLDPDLHQIKADRGQLEQVLLNLVVNARDAMPGGGKLTIETANIYLDTAYVQKYADAQVPGHYVMLAVSDTGHGMDAATQQKIFEPFFTTKEPGKGTGLGLATVFGIVKQHEGMIWVYSEPGNGATFKIYLPRTEDSAQIPAAIAPEPRSVYGSETILVVEDEQMVRQLICETLAAYGYKVIEGQSASDGLRLALDIDETIHLLLTDVVMPVMNGPELYQRIIAVRADIKVLYASGYTDKVVLHHGILDGAVNFLQKPFTIQDLARKVRQVLG